jgi:hypothetical protein
MVVPEEMKRAVDQEMGRVILDANSLLRRFSFANTARE